MADCQRKRALIVMGACPYLGPSPGEVAPVCDGWLLPTWARHLGKWAPMVVGVRVFAWAIPAT